MFSTKGSIVREGAVPNLVLVDGCEDCICEG